MPSPFDTIVAPITGAESAAVAVVRLSGEESWAIASNLFSPWPANIRARFALYGRYVTGDDGLCLPFEEGHSYTGEMSIEFSVHGSRASVQSLVEACIVAGARSARPGEFTERAFLKGRIDLTQAEGVRDTVEALTQAQLRQANLLREGALRSEVEAVSEEITGVLAKVEASVDFSEEIGELDKPSSIATLQEAGQRLDRLLRTAEAGRILRRGFRIAIVGPPNAGKSSLLNRLLGYDRAIVTDVPGTTRDFVEERIDLGGVPCVLTDTAGLRHSEDLVENLGIDRSNRIIEGADQVWYVFDSNQGWTELDSARLADISRPTLVLANKVDLNDSQLPSGTQFLPISALTGDGLDSLTASISERLNSTPHETVWINERHQPLIRSTMEHLEATIETLSRPLPTDLASVHLQAALEDLGEVTGTAPSTDLLTRIFSDFCIGK